MNKTEKPWLRFAFRAILAITLLAPSSLFAQFEDDEEELEAFRITGSRIPRIDLTGVNPVETLTRDTLDERGFANVAEAIQALPFNTGQSLTPDSSGTSFASGISTVNLRGIGNNNVLVLINGRRAAPAGASGFNGFQSLFDLNSLPASAIERIDILKDGASAIYGSDAVSGVINIVLRSDYDGLSVRTRIGNTYVTDSLEKFVSAVYGARSERTSILVTADWYERNALFARDYDFTSNADLRDIGGLDRTSTAGWPALTFVPGLGYRSFMSPQANPTVADSVPFGTPRPGQAAAGRYNFLLDSDLIPQQKRYGFYANLKHEFSEDLYAFTELSFRRSQAVTQAAPAPAFNFNEQGFGFQFVGPLNDPSQYAYDTRLNTRLGGRFFQINPETGAPVLDGEGNRIYPDNTNRAYYNFNVRDTGFDNVDGGAIQIPAYNPFNPFGQTLVYDVRYRAVEVGNRLNEVTSDTPRFVAGLGGKVNDWEWEGGVAYSKSTFTNLNGGSVQDELLQLAFHGVDFEGETLYLNPFGPSDPRIIDFIRITNPNVASFEIRGYDFTANTPIFEAPAGSVGLAVGAEFREEKLDDRRTSLNETGQIVGGSEGSSVKGSRDVFSLFAELVIPVLPNLEVQLAGRYEEYSDFGNTTRPKIAASYRPIPSVLLRGSYGKSFLAPNLPFLYTAQSTSFTPQAVADPKRPDAPLQQIRTLGGGNPDLQPEDTTGYFAGIAFNPREGALRGLFIGVDYFVFDSENLIDRFGATEILANEDEPAFAGLVVRGTPAPGEQFGQILFVRTTWENLSVRKYRGVDVDIRYTFDTDRFGRFNTGISWTYLLEYSFEGTEFQGSRLYPRNRGNLTGSWVYGDFSASVFVNYIDRRTRTNGPLNKYGSFTTVNPRFTYRGFYDMSITLGATNIFNRTPPVDYGEAERWTPIMSPQKGFWYLEVGKDF